MFSFDCIGHIAKIALQLFNQGKIIVSHNILLKWEKEGKKFKLILTKLERFENLNLFISNSNLNSSVRTICISNSSPISNRKIRFASLLLSQQCSYEFYIKLIYILRGSRVIINNSILCHVLWLTFVLIALRSDPHSDRDSCSLRLYIGSMNAL